MIWKVYVIFSWKQYHLKLKDVVISSRFVNILCRFATNIQSEILVNFNHEHILLLFYNATIEYIDNKIMTNTVIS